MNTEKATPELFAALAAAQGEVENASKNAANPHYRSKYADLAEVLNTVRPVFSKHGIAILQSTEFDGERVTVTTTLGHSSGGSVSSSAACVPAKADAQGIGSATTYLRRYSLAAMAGIAQEDDDGNAGARERSHAQGYDITPWIDGIAGAADKTELDGIAAQLRDARGVPDAAMRNIRAAWAKRAKELAE